MCVCVCALILLTSKNKREIIPIMNNISVKSKFAISSFSFGRSKMAELEFPLFAPPFSFSISDTLAISFGITLALYN